MIANENIRGIQTLVTRRIARTNCRIIPPKTLEELPPFQEKIRDVIEKA